MIKYFFYVALFILSATTIHCTKTSTTPDDSNTLPPETQTGTGTFACKINGVVWKYKDPDYVFLDTRPKTTWSFIPNERAGKLLISGQRYSNSSNSIADDVLQISSDSLTLIKERITIGEPAAFGIGFNNYNASIIKCQYFASQQVYDTSKNFFREGKLTLTKLDQSAKIISGTFYCTIYQTGCDTLKITEGRFDLKYK